MREDALDRRILSTLDASSADVEALLGGGRRINAEPEDVERGLAQLVLTLVDFLRQLMERQAVHRMEAGELTDDEVERVGQTFMALEQRMGELREAFALSEEDLNVHLGPLGRLM